MSEPTAFDITVDGKPVPHHSTHGIRATLRTWDGDSCEVQVAKIGEDLVVTIDGIVATKVSERGHFVVAVGPKTARAPG